MDGGAGAGHWRGGNVLIAVDEEGIGLSTRQPDSSRRELMVGSMDGCSICFTLHIDAPNRGIIGHCGGDDDDGGDGDPTFGAHWVLPEYTRYSGTQASTTPFTALQTHITPLRVRQ
jgi:hypothetical protein